MKKFALILAVISLISCKKDPVDKPDTSTPTQILYQNGAGVTDVDGNTYKTIVIKTNSKSNGSTTQEWMSENLKTTKYSNGVNIDLQNIAVCNSDSTTMDSLGLLYNWPAIMNNSTTAGSQGACPNGWHIPTVDEYSTLINALGGTAVAGLKMKSTNSAFWNDITLANNLSGFNAHGGGWRSYLGMDFLYKQSTMFWTSTEDVGNAKIIQLNSNSENVISAGTNKGTFVSCRCIKD